MWAIRILSGPQAGRVYSLKSGPNVVGRAPSCDVKIVNPNISKEHIKIEVLQDRIMLTDLHSRNGTFVNGTQKKSHKLRPGDQIGLHDTLIEVIPMQAAQQLDRAGGSRAAHFGNLAEPDQNYNNEELSGNAPHPMNNLAAPKFVQVAQAYMDRVVMPGIYRLAEIMDYKTLLALFMAGFVLLVTSLSTIPLIRILRDSVEQQSQQHALTIAATLARVNESAVREGLYSAINMSTAQRIGVSDAMIVAKVDGKIIAPSSKAESYPDIAFVHEARNGEKEDVKQVDNNTVVAVYPIAAYNPETGARGTLAFAVIKYDMTTLAVSDSKTISLFITTLFIAAILGVLLFYFFYRLVEYPLTSLNAQLDNALREGRDDLKTTFLFEPLVKLTSNINSALSRAQNPEGGGQVPRSMEHDRRIEMTNLAEMIGFAGLIVSAFDRSVVAINQGFEQRTRIDPSNLINQPISTISDQALKLSLLDLMDRLDQNPDQLANNEIEFGGSGFQLVAQAIFGTSKVAYYIVILIPVGGEA